MAADLKCLPASKPGAKAARPLADKVARRG